MFQVQFQRPTTLPLWPYPHTWFINPPLSPALDVPSAIPTLVATVLQAARTMVSTAGIHSRKPSSR